MVKQLIFVFCAIALQLIGSEIVTLICLIACIILGVLWVATNDAHAKKHDKKEISTKIWNG